MSAVCMYAPASLLSGAAHATALHHWRTETEPWA